MKKYSPHLGHFSLIEACAQPGCPICSIRKNTINTYLLMVLSEYVDDPDLREQLCNSWGYCQKHAWMLPSVERGNLLTVAIMYHDIIEREAKKAFTQGSGKKGGGIFSRLIYRVFKGKQSNAPRQYLSLHLHCPACKLGNEVETNALRIMLKAFDQEDVQMHTALKNSDGLCFPHIRRAFELTQNPAVLDALMTLTREKFAEVQEELSEFIRKHDYRFQHERIGDEKNSWKRAINLIVGTES